MTTLVDWEMFMVVDLPVHKGGHSFMVRVYHKTDWDDESRTNHVSALNWWLEQEAES